MSTAQSMFATIRREAKLHQEMVCAITGGGRGWNILGVGKGVQEADQVRGRGRISLDNLCWILTPIQINLTWAAQICACSSLALNLAQACLFQRRQGLCPEWTTPRHSQASWNTGDKQPKYYLLSRADLNRVLWGLLSLSPFLQQLEGLQSEVHI